MDSKYIVRLDIHFNPRVLRWFLAGLIVLGVSVDLSSENVTLNTYYPAPSGVYAQMITTGNTFLARDGGAASKVGVGTINPMAKLDVVGNLRIKDGTEAAGRVLTSDAQGYASWSPSRPLPPLLISKETNCDALRGKTRSCPMGVHQVCFLTAADGPGDDFNQCIISGSPGAAWSINSQNADDPIIHCRSRCLN